MTLELVVGAIVLAFLLLVARGVYVIGRGRDVEYKAREKSSSGSVGGTGFQLLDLLRYGDLPLVSTIEEWLGRDDSDERAQCRDCRNTWVSGQASATPVCPNCGQENTRLVEEVNS